MKLIAVVVGFRGLRRILDHILWCVNASSVMIHHNGSGTWENRTRKAIQDLKIDSDETDKKVSRKTLFLSSRVIRT